jgi:hypothetical protein
MKDEMRVWGVVQKYYLSKGLHKNSYIQLGFKPDILQI